MKIVVIGGTGLIGSKLVTRLDTQGHDALPASPESGVDTLTGEGLAEAFEGASVVVDVSNSPSFEDAAVLEFFETSTRNILAAESDAGVGHHVALSVAGTQRLSESGYFRAKLAQEQLIAAASIRYSIVHPTQFYEFVGSIAKAATDGDTVRVAHVLIQHIAADDGAAAVGRVAVGPALNAIVEVAGPEQFHLDDLIGRGLRARKRPPRGDRGPALARSPSRRAAIPSSIRCRARVTRDRGRQPVAAARRRRRRREQSRLHRRGPVVLAAHSYGGAVISNVDAGAGDIVGLVYVAGFAPDAGESAFSLAAMFPGSTLGDAARPVARDDGTTDLYIARDRFRAQFCADVPADQAARMAATQRPVTQEALTEPSGERPLWRQLPSWFVFGELDRSIPAEREHYMAKRAGAHRTIEIPGASHAISVSHPEATSHLIIEAAAAHVAV